MIRRRLGQLRARLGRLSPQELRKRAVRRFHDEMSCVGLLRSGLRNKYAGRRCFILGNGPSLKHTDLSLLRNEFTFGANRLYMLFDEIGFETTFYLVTDPNIVEHYHQDINRVKAQKFLRPYHREYFRASKDAIYIKDIAPHAPHFAFNPAFGLWTAGTVTYVALQLAHYMGFETAILVGVDHSYAEAKAYKGGAVTARDRVILTSQGDDPNHFSPNYYQPGVPWVVPNPEMTELAYRMAKYAFEREGRRVVDATIGGKLQVFPKAEYRSLFAT